MFLQTHATDENYYLPLPKIRICNKKYTEKPFAHFYIVHGPWIDIFIYDYQYEKESKEKNKQRKFNKKAFFNSWITPVIYNNLDPKQFRFKTMIKKIMIESIKLSQKNHRGIIMRYLDYKYQKLESVIMDLAVNNSSGEMLTYSFLMNENNPPKVNSLNISDFNNRILTRFENYEFYIPKNYDKILTNMYENYREFPPPEKRKSHHLWV